MKSRRCIGMTKSGRRCRRFPKKGTESCVFHAPADATTCVICIDDVNDPFELQCKHVFCTLCILGWLARKRACPLCNTIPSREIISEEYTAPADARYYDATGRPEDFTSEAELVDAAHAEDSDDESLSARLIAYFMHGLEEVIR